jgi:hypothetical protein
MKKRIMVAFATIITTVAALTGIGPTQTAHAALGSCGHAFLYSGGERDGAYVQCMSGTGYVRIKVICKLTASSSGTTLYGPKVGVGGTSVKWCGSYGSAYGYDLIFTSS